MGKLEHSFIQMFKSNVSKMINNKERLNVLINCDLVSIECNRWRKCVENKQQINVSNKVYDILKQKNNDENIMQYIYIDGVIQHHHVQKMSHLPYISFIIRPKQTQKMNFKQFQELFLTQPHKKYFVVKFNHSHIDIKGIMFSITPSLIMLRIYLKFGWNTKCVAIHDKVQELTRNEALNNEDMQSLNKCVQSMLDLKKNNKIKNGMNEKPKDNKSRKEKQMRLKCNLKKLYT